MKRPLRDLMYIACSHSVHSAEKCHSWHLFLVFRLELYAGGLPPEHQRQCHKHTLSLSRFVGKYALCGSLTGFLEDFAASIRRSTAARCLIDAAKIETLARVLGSVTDVAVIFGSASSFHTLEPSSSSTKPEEI